MKVKIGGYINYYGPYQLTDLLQHIGVSEDRSHAIGSWISEKLPFIETICSWIYNNRKRTMNIHIDNYDVWSMDNTLAHIILPMLKRLKEQKHGSPMVDDEDVPEHLRCPNRSSNESFQLDMFAGEELDNLVWESYHKKWDWVMDEMIWTFEQKVNDNWEEQYWIEKPKIDWTKQPEDEGEEFIPVRWEVEGKCDWEGRRRHQERITNGFRLFGKYYEGFWD